MIPIIIETAKMTDEQQKLVGSKAYNLGVLQGLGLKVPESFILTTAFLDIFLSFNSIDLDRHDPESIIMGVFPEELINPLREQFEQIACEGVTLVCRSSSLAEDQANLSFAGQFSTILGIKAFEDLLQAIKICWYTSFAERVQSYGKYFSSTDYSKIALIVQRLVNSAKAGILFTNNPVNSAPEIIIEGVWGNGVSAVGNLTSPDRIVAPLDDKITYTVNSKSIAVFWWDGLDRCELGDYLGIPIMPSLPEQFKLFEKDPFGCMGYVHIADEIAKKPCLDDAEISQLIESAKKINHTYPNQDIEWAIDFTGELYLLQMRPITTSPGQQRVLAEQGTILTGIPASPGESTGPVKVVKNQDDFYKVNDGDIFVCHSTNPDYLPIMVKASGIIAEDGGILSHTAIVSRELGIPCVMNCSNATSLLKDWDYIAVSGTAGTVEFASETVDTADGAATGEMTYQYLYTVPAGEGRYWKGIVVDPLVIFEGYEREQLLNCEEVSMAGFIDYLAKLLNLCIEQKVILDLNYPARGCFAEIFHSIIDTPDILERFWLIVVSQTNGFLLPERFQERVKSMGELQEFELLSILKEWE